MKEMDKSDREHMLARGIAHLLPYRRPALLAIPWTWEVCFKNIVD
jgi:hypothetical protein